ncbi:response regulator [Leptothermofonsia sichuanensis E412]|uniref:hybrid sensor histidine kinase/response regulator n=1 Tax=Leptothermofonsia sichuanensis TaxID=2917832 RepID=UPI001CA7384A|nr:response regulator [Leptothermofonsia sichuanensis]QZZ18829.1 response regulator [Leptothermofonsia sichuanensis E412]
MKKILVIEDERSMRETILELLEAEGFQGIGAENGSIGIQKAQEYLPDLILCDVVMPHLDGYGVLSSLRHNPATATIPFIFLTAMGARERVREGMQMGADDYLTKPFTAEELLGAIASRFARQAILTSQSQQQLDDLRNSIALSLPHELRTPLHGILGLAGLLLEDYQTIERQEILEIAEGIYAAADRLHRLIQNYLLYVELELTTKDLNRITRLRSASTHYPKVLIANVATQIAKRYGRETDLFLNLENTVVQIADLKLHKIAEELIDNAFKFSKAGTAIQLTTVADAEGLTLWITNHGRGMTADQIASLGAYMQFERKFYEQQGSGLGLAIAKRLVELHGGSLSIESTPGQQTTIQVTLPGSHQVSTNPRL